MPPYHHINESQHKQRRFTRHYPKRYTKTKIRGLLWWLLFSSLWWISTNKTINRTLSFSLSLSLLSCILACASFSNPNSTQTFSNSPKGLFPPQPTINFIISSILCCMSLSVTAPMRIPLFSWLFFIPICSIFVTFSSHVVSSHCLDNQKSLLLL